MKHININPVNKVTATDRLWFFLCASVVFSIDLVSKKLITSTMAPYQSIPVIPDFFHITFIYNRGATFGILQEYALFFIIVSCLVTLAICCFALFGSRLTRLPRILLGLITGGALGNVFDRIRYGAVVDFIDFRGIWPYIFNMADTAIVCGGILLAAFVLLEDRKKTLPKH